jgi:DNA-binding GntR family transcriptional regulator
MRYEPRRLDGGSAVIAHTSLVAALHRRDSSAARAALEEDIGAAADHIEHTARLPE